MIEVVKPPFEGSGGGEVDQVVDVDVEGVVAVVEVVVVDVVVEL